MCEACLSLYTSLELLLATGGCLQRDLLHWEGRLACVSGASALGREEGVLKERLENFVETICQQTALYCSKLLQVGIEFLPSLSPLSHSYTHSPLHIHIHPSHTHTHIHIYPSTLSHTYIHTLPSHTYTHFPLLQHTHTLLSPSQGVDKEVEDTINESYSSLQESLDSLTQQTGGLCLSKRVMEKLQSTTVCTVVAAADWQEGGGEDEFLSFQVHHFISHWEYVSVATSSVNHYNNSHTHAHMVPFPHSLSRIRNLRFYFTKVTVIGAF